MHTNDARERGFESALRDTLAAPASVPLGDCVDGETLAAWSEGSLPALQAESVELHLSSCPSCQALLAAFVRTTPVQVAAVPLWRRWQLQWLVPLATATGALVIWLSIPGRPPAVSSPVDVQMAREERPIRELTAPTSPRPQADSRKELNANQLPAAGESSSAALKRPSRPTAALTAAAPTARPQQTAGATTDALAKSIQDKQKREADSRVAMLADAAATPPAAAAPARVDDAEAARARAALEERKTAEAPAPLPVLRESVVVPPVAKAPPATAAAEAPPQAVPMTPAEPAAANRQSVVGGLQARAFGAATISVASPNTTSRWSITIGGAITFFGKTAPAGLVADIPASTTILAGSSPREEVCWMVGRAGAVYLTTDGTHFTRVVFPDAVDLIAVRATDAQTVTVTSSAGRTYRSTDAGKSWQSQ